MEYHAEFAGGYTVTLRVSAKGVEMRWSPGIPQLNPEEAKKFLVAYRLWRNECLADFAKREGIKIAVFD